VRFARFVVDISCLVEPPQGLPDEQGIFPVSLFSRTAGAQGPNRNCRTTGFDRARSALRKPDPGPNIVGSEKNFADGENICRNYRIRPKETIAFTTARLDPEGILVLDLNAVRVATKSPKGSAK
jgi:hypothetical protein